MTMAAELFGVPMSRAYHSPCASGGGSVRARPSTPAKTIDRMKKSQRLAPLETLFETQHGRLLPLPPKLQRLYGTFRLPTRRSAPYVFSNFVTTLDGVVSLQTRGHSAGGDISGFNLEDRMVMGLLRAVADVVIVGSGTLEADSRTAWSPQAICPELTDDYRRLRLAMGEREAALTKYRPVPPSTPSLG